MTLRRKLLSSLGATGGAIGFGILAILVNLVVLALVVAVVIAAAYYTLDFLDVLTLVFAGVLA